MIRRNLPEIAGASIFEVTMKEESRNGRSSAWLGRAGWTRSLLTIGVLSWLTPATAQGNTVIDLTYDSVMEMVCTRIPSEHQGSSQSPSHGVGS
jgi:hypothetical protein